MKIKNLEFADKCSTSDGEKRLRSFATTICEELYGKKEITQSVYSAAAGFRQMDRCQKKFDIDSESDTLHARAVCDFLQLNRLLKSHGCFISDRIIHDARDFIHEALVRATVSLSKGNAVGPQCEFDLTTLLGLWKLGPGSAFGIPGDESHPALKLLEADLTVTEKSLPLARALIKSDPILYKANMLVRLRCVRGSELFTVPKNETTRRTAAKEPVMNMALQLSGGVYVEEALRCIGIDIRTQAGINNVLAMVGSMTGDLATLDLKSASDMILLLLIQLLWPEAWYSFFTTVRSEEILVDGEWHELNMMSTMGNGFTFPMMTLTILALIYAVQSRRCQKRFMMDYKKTGVFGDDIIVPTKDVDSLVGVLELAGFVVNYGKSYSSGAFRESCGGDYFKGFDITPFYVKSLRSDAEVYVAINQLLRWSAKTGLYLPSTCAMLINLLSSRPCFVPFWEPDTSGIRTGKVGSSYRCLIELRSQTLLTLKWDKPSESEGFCSELDYASLSVILKGYVNGTGGTKVVMATRREPKYHFVFVDLPKGFLTGIHYSDNELCIDSQHNITSFLVGLTAR